MEHQGSVVPLVIVLPSFGIPFNNLHTDPTCCWTQAGNLPWCRYDPASSYLGMQQNDKPIIGVHSNFSISAGGHVDQPSGIGGLIRLWTLNMFQNDMQLPSLPHGNWWYYNVHQCTPSRQGMHSHNVLYFIHLHNIMANSLIWNINLSHGPEHKPALTKHTTPAQHATFLPWRLRKFNHLLKRCVLQVGMFPAVLKKTTWLELLLNQLHSGNPIQ